MSAVTQGQAAPRSSIFNDPKFRSTAIQVLLVLAIGWFAWRIVHNTQINLHNRNISSGFQFLWSTAGFGVNQALISYSETSSYGRALLVGLLNTLLVAGVGILFATLLGFTLGIMRLSRNWLVAKVAEIYVEIVRNIPLLLQIFVWYATVLKPLPAPARAPQIGLPWPGGGFIIMAAVLGGGAWLLRGLYQRTQSVVMRVVATLLLFFAAWTAIGVVREFGLSTINFVPLGIFLSNRGIMFPRPIFGESMWIELAALVVGIVLALGVARWARRRQEQTGQQFPTLWVSLGLILGLPLIVFLTAGAGATFEFPELKGFNFRGGMTLIPEFLALVIALSTYTASFIAEIVRAGIQAVSHGQTEAAHALGVRPGVTLRLVVIPQAMRVIIPPLASQYLNLTKNSSLAVAIGYPDLVAMGGTVLNQTGQAIEIIAIWMVVYLSLSLMTSAFMNWFNSRMRLVER
ncbi:MAG TPA: amino acid ABC transporter permease [Aestuariivirgaceae bacterium]|jgi:general L-amino acid transport system permease protein|nr:amino acid ABC transporter permease [Aestuariivirgaceae bacterium]